MAELLVKIGTGDSARELVIGQSAITKEDNGYTVAGEPVEILGSAEYSHEFGKDPVVKAGPMPRGFAKSEDSGKAKK